MAENTKISWATHTFNPWIGCSKVHTGCKNCYAKAMAGRLGVTWGPDGTRRRTADSTWRQVEKWNRQAAPGICTCPGGIAKPYTSHNWPCPAVVDRPRVFPSLCDPFEDWHGWVLDSKGQQLFRGPDPSPDGYHPASSMVTLADIRRDFFALIDRCPNLDFLLLTKRPENIRRMWRCDGNGKDPGAADYLRRHNAWLLYSASDQKTLEAGLPHLLACRDLVPVIGLSLEPLVGPVDLGLMVGPAYGQRSGQPRRVKPDWVIVGGESGPRARPCDVSWIRSIVSQCREAGVPCFVKQLGTCAMARKDSVAGRIKGDHPEAEWPGGTRFGSWNSSHVGTEWQGRHVRLEDPNGGDPSEWPEDLRVREFPKL